jgi:hypothetical protein
MTSAIQTKILLSILAVLTMFVTWYMQRSEPLQMDQVIQQKLSHAAAPQAKPYLIP